MWKCFYLWACKNSYVAVDCIAYNYILTLFSVITNWICLKSCWIWLIIICVCQSMTTMQICTPYYHILKTFQFVSLQKQLHCYCLYSIRLLFDIVFCHYLLCLARIILDFTDNYFHASSNDNHLDTRCTLLYFENLSISGPLKSSQLLLFL